MASARYPGKALAPLAGRPLLDVLLERMQAARGVDGVALATSVQPENDPLAALAGRRGVSVFRGDEDDVLRRHVDCAHALGAAPRGARHRRQPAHRHRDAGAAGRAAPGARAPTTPTCPATRC